MIRSTPSLESKLDRRRTADKVTEKFIAGQRLRFAWAGSAIELSSHAAALVLIDERDRMEEMSAARGDPVALAEARTGDLSGRQGRDHVDADPRRRISDLEPVRTGHEVPLGLAVSGVRNLFRAVLRSAEVAGEVHR
jgi:phage terminase large subunit GpA-like protein